MSHTIRHQIGKSIVVYDPDSGQFVWETAYRKPSRVGCRAEHMTTNGYLYIKAAGKHNSASRLAWFLVNGQIPDKLEIDHIDRDKTNNRIANLRLVDRKGNLWNRKFRPNECGVTGVSIHRKTGLYRARYRDMTYYAGTIAEAAVLYEAMKNSHEAINQLTKA